MDEEPTSNDGSPFPLDDFIALTVGASLAKFTSSVADHRRVLDTIQRSVFAKPFERPTESLDRLRRRRAENAADKHMQRIRAQVTAAAPPPDAAQQAKRHHPPGDEQLFAWFMTTLIGPAAVADVGRQFAEDCDDDPETARYAIAYAQWKYRAPLGDSVGTALVPATTSAFEELLAALLRLWLTRYPDALGVDKTQIAVGVARSYRDSDDIFRSAVDDKVRAVLQKSPFEWSELLERKLKFSLESLTKYWDEVIEVFARRNVIVHWGGRADDDYLSRLPQSATRPATGAAVITDLAYSRRTFDLFEHLGIALAVAFLAHLVPKGPLPAEYSADFLYLALKEHRPQDAWIIADAVVRDRELRELPGVVQVNWLMARRDVGEDPALLKQEIEAWVPPNDDLDYAIARAALLRDEDGLVSLMEGRLRKDSDALRGVAEWPLLEDMAELSPRIAHLLREGRSRPPKQRPAPVRRRPRR